MDHWNKNLQLSLESDLQILTKISSKILATIPSFELNSWLFPAKGFNDVSGSFFGILKKKQYQVYLENIIERLYVIINLFVNYIEALLPNKPIRNVSKPKNLALGSSVELLWKKIQDFSYLVTSTTLKNNAIPSSKSVQTDLCYASECNSCTTATCCIKELTEELGNSIPILALDKTRTTLRKDIFNITKNGCMHRLTTAIITDVAKFVKHLGILESKNQEYSTKLINLSTKYYKALNMVESFKMTTKRNQKRLKTVKAKNDLLLKKVDDLGEAYKHLRNELLVKRQLCTTLEYKLETSTNSLSAVRISNQYLRKEITAVTLSKQEIHKENINVRRQYEGYKQVNAEMLDIVRAFLSSMNQSTLVLTKVMQKTDASLTEGINVANQFSKLKLHAQQLDKPIVTTTCSQTDSICSSLSEVKGDPIEDMTKQIEENSSNINKLETFNLNLRRTIRRIKNKDIIYNL